MREKLKRIERVSSQDLRFDAGQETSDEPQLPPFTDSALSSYTLIFYTYHAAPSFLRLLGT